MSHLHKLFRTVAGVVFAVLGVSLATAQDPAQLPPALADLPGLTAETPFQQTSGFGRTRGGQGCYAPCPPGTPCPPPGYSYPPGTQPPSTQPGMTDPTMPQTQQPTTAPDFGEMASGADIGPTVGLGGYLENAAPVTMARLRYDAGWNNNRPDRGEFFYAKCGCFNTRDAHGPPLMEKRIDYQDLITTAEYAFSQRFSAFVNLPVRFLNPQVNRDTAGLSDVSFGGKYAFIYNQNRVVSLYLQFQAPSGTLSTGLGNGNWWIEPGILYLEQLTKKWQLFGQVVFQTPLGRRSDFTGNMINYGLGTSYVVSQGSWGYVAPVVEAMGWTILSGREFNPDAGAAVASRGETIVNGKFGVRIGFGSPVLGTPYPTRSDFYIGYARALTGTVWYKDLLHIEYRRFF